MDSFLNFFTNLNWLKIFELLIPSLISIFSVFFARFLEKQKEIEKQIREQKIKIYGELTKLLLEDVMGSTKNNKPLSNSVIAKYPKICNDLIFWGSDEVVKQYQKTFQSFANPDIIAMMRELENLLLAIRKDTGHKNKGLENFDLLKVFINDLDKALKEEKENQLNKENNKQQDVQPCCTSKK